MSNKPQYADILTAYQILRAGYEPTTSYYNLANYIKVDAEQYLSVTRNHSDPTKISMIERIVTELANIL